METFLGVLCKRGHDYQGTGQSLRTKLRRDCVECRKLGDKRYLKRNREKHNIHSARQTKFWRERDYFSYTCVPIRHRAKSKGIPFDLDGTYLKELWESQSGRCYWLNVEMNLKLTARHPNRATVDRLHPDRGYVKGNVVWACSFANVGRGDFPPDDFRAFLDGVKYVVPNGKV